LTDCVVPFLHQRKNLGLHTDIYTNQMFRLQQQGIINNSQKNIDRGYTVVAQAHGSAELYEFLHRNPAIEFQPTSYVSDPHILAKIDNLIVIEGALKVDLTGQVVTDSLAHKFYGGVWSTDHSIRGAQFSKGGKPIVILPSRSSAGRSNILFELPPGTGVTVTRSDVEWVVTEYGIANLYGKSIRDRCLALIEIAHPEFRSQLLEHAKRYKYLSDSQSGASLFGHYPASFECLHLTKTGKPVFVRPIKAKDEDRLRQFFHKLSNHSVYLRYFRRMESLPQRVLQKYSDIDYHSDMALVVLSPPPRTSITNNSSMGASEMVAIGQWIADPRPNVVNAPPEIAFQVRDDWQGEGLGKYLFQRLVEMSQSGDRTTTQFKADVLADNKGMRHIFETSGVPFQKRTEFGVVTYTFFLDKYKLKKEGTITASTREEG
jgi:GNAT superfamily N-acetyltransferase